MFFKHFVLQVNIIVGTLHALYRLHVRLLVLKHLVSHGLELRLHFVLVLDISWLEPLELRLNLILNGVVPHKQVFPSRVNWEVHFARDLVGVIIPK